MMRNFEERKAEVFRRSENRIRERKRRRNHILMACVPLALCVTILGVFLLPGVTTDSALDPGETQPVMDGMCGSVQSPSLTCPIAEITVSGNGLSRSYTEAEALLQIADRLDSYGTGEPSTNGTTNEDLADEAPEDNAEYVAGSVMDCANASYTITLIMQEGERTQYLLSGNRLQDLTAKESYTLTQTQANELRELLGIPQG